MRLVKFVLLTLVFLAPASLAGGLTFHGHHDPQVLLGAIGDPMAWVNGTIGTNFPIGGTGLVFLGVNLLLLWTLVLILFLLWALRRPRLLRQRVAELEGQNQEQAQFIDELSAKLEMKWGMVPPPVPSKPQ